jgi:hypothetical protein
MAILSHVVTSLPRLLALPAAAAALVAAVLVVAAPAQEPPPPGPLDDPTKPLVYVFALDSLDGERAVEQARAPFLRSLVNGEGARATYYRESRAQMVAETNTNHAAMVTGAYGERSGIAGNTFAVYGPQEKEACPEDGGSFDFTGTRPPAQPGAAQVTSGESPACLLAETVFTALKRRAPDVVTAGIFGKPKLARLFESKKVDPATYDAGHLYAPCEQRSSDPPYCRDDFIDPVQRYTDDEFVVDEIIRTVNEGVPAGGARRRPHFTFVNFPDIDQAGHATGAGAAYEAQILRTDLQLRRFVDNQKARGLWERTVVFFVSDHSMDSTPPSTNSLQRAFGADADRVEVVLNGSVDMVYLKDRNAPDRHELLKRLRAAAVANPGVDEALYRRPNPVDGGEAHTLDAVHPAWRIAGERTGDLLVTSKRMGAFGEPLNPLNGNHGAPNTLDNTFVVAGGDPRIVQQTVDGVRDPGGRFDDTLANPGQAENVDVAPTVMALFGQAPPADNQGRVLTEAFAPGTFTVPTGQSCDLDAGLRSLRVRPAGGGLRVTFDRRAAPRVTVDVFRQSERRTVLGNRLVARFERSRSFTWSGRGTRARTGSGLYFVRVRTTRPGGRVEQRRFAFTRTSAGRFRSRPAYDRRAPCGLLAAAKLERTVFGGARNRPLGIAFRTTAEARVGVEVLRGTRVVRRFRESTRRAGQTHRLRLPAEPLRARGDYTVRITVRATDGRQVVARLTARRL